MSNGEIPKRERLNFEERLQAVAWSARDTVRRTLGGEADMPRRYEIDGGVAMLEDHANYGPGSPESFDLD
jgi:hypothetical protein